MISVSLWPIFYSFCDALFCTASDIPHLTPIDNGTDTSISLSCYWSYCILPDSSLMMAKLI